MLSFSNQTKNILFSQNWVDLTQPLMINCH
nr:MAG TPA: hypothetical protein [Caudoviricetes sp.]